MTDRMMRPADDLRPCFRCKTVAVLNADYLCVTCGEPDEPCNWYAGCDEIADPETDNLCPFHFDACERPEHAEAQRQHEARVAALKAEIKQDEESWTRIYELGGASTVAPEEEAA